MKIDSLYVLLLYSKVLAELRLVLRVINRDSILTELERDWVGTSFAIIGGCDSPNPLICISALGMFKLKANRVDGYNAANSSPTDG